jgi:ribose-phosphate pyrophosphokinase
MIIVPGPASPLLSSRIAKEADCRLAHTEYRKFPDGELFVRVKDVQKEHAVVVQSLSSPEDWIYLLLLVDACEKASKVSAVIPYMGYARQDKRFCEGEPLSIGIVARTVESVGVDAIYTVNLHNSGSSSLFKKLRELDAMPELGNSFSHEKCIFISPDRGSLNRVKRAAEKAGVDWDYMEKKRIDSETVEVYPKNIDIEGKDVVIMDDIISTGGTIATAARALLELGANKVLAACVHPVLAGNALIKMHLAGVEEVLATDTIEKPVSKITVSKIIADRLVNE